MTIADRAPRYYYYLNPTDENPDPIKSGVVGRGENFDVIGTLATVNYTNSPGLRQTKMEVVTRNPDAHIAARRRLQHTLLELFTAISGQRAGIEVFFGLTAKIIEYDARLGYGAVDNYFGIIELNSDQTREVFALIAPTKPLPPFPDPKWYAKIIDQK